MKGREIARYAALLRRSVAVNCGPSPDSCRHTPTNRTNTEVEPKVWRGGGSVVVGVEVEFVTGASLYLAWHGTVSYLPWKKTGSVSQLNFGGCGGEATAARDAVSNTDAINRSDGHPRPRVLLFRSPGGLYYY